MTRRARPRAGRAPPEKVRAVVRLRHVKCEYVFVVRAEVFEEMRTQSQRVTRCAGCDQLRPNLEFRVVVVPRWAR